MQKFHRLALILFVILTPLVTSKRKHGTTGKNKVSCASVLEKTGSVERSVVQECHYLLF